MRERKYVRRYFYNEKKKTTTKNKKTKKLWSIKVWKKENSNQFRDSFIFIDFVASFGSKETADVAATKWLPLEERLEKGKRQKKNESVLKIFQFFRRYDSFLKVFSLLFNYPFASLFFIHFFFSHSITKN